MENVGRQTPRYGATTARLALQLVIVVIATSCAFSQQMADEHFNATVATPAHVSEHPKILLDEAHHNFHTADGRYKPLAELLHNDGYEIVRGHDAFSAKSLVGIRVLLIANALGTGATAGTDTSPPAFTQAECDTVRDWVHRGGSLLLISDHTPFGMAAENLASAFGVKFGKGFVFALDPKYINEDQPTTLVFSRANGLLGDHPITRGRSDRERINTIVAFTGQSLSVPKSATPLMTIADVAEESPSRFELQKVLDEFRSGERERGRSSQHAVPSHGAQGIAMTFGEGRVVILGEAALMSAQVVKFPSRPDIKMGMNAPGSDDRQFALNVLHWLSGILN